MSATDLGEAGPTPAEPRRPRPRITVAAVARAVTDGDLVWEFGRTLVKQAMANR